jgi:hypothetical protein
MAKKKAERFESAGEVHEVLEACLSHVQQPMVVELPTDLWATESPKSARTRSSPKLIATAVVLSIIAVTSAVWLLFSAFHGGSEERLRAEARRAFADARSQLDLENSTGDPTNAVGALLTNKLGREYLIRLDREFENFAYDDRFAFDDESAGAVFIWNRNQNDGHPHKQMLIRSFSKNRSGSGFTAGMPHQIHLKSVRIQDGKLVIGYVASDKTDDKAGVEEIFGLIPGASYEVEVDIVDVIKNRTDWIEPFKGGDATNALHRKPFSWLMREANGPGPDSELAVDELLRREDEGLLSSKQDADLIDLVLKYQADRERPWRTELGDLIEKRWVAGKLDRNLWEQYTAQFLVDTYELKVRPRIVIGSPIVRVQQIMRDVRCGSGKHITYQLREKNRVTRIGSTIVGRYNPTAIYPLSRVTSTNSYSIDKQQWATIKPGKHKITREVELSFLEDPGPEGAKVTDVFASRKVTFETETTFLPPGQSTVNINSDPALKAAVEGAITVFRIETGPMSRPTTSDKFYAKVILDGNPRPIDTVFTIVLKDGENEYRAGSTAMQAADGSGLNSMASIPVDLSGKRIDVILRPDPDEAEASIDCFEIWGEEIVFKDVLVRPK